MSEAFICDAVRTPFGRYGGSLAGVRADDLAAVPLRALQERNAGVDWSSVDDVVYGCANQAGEDNRNVARMALLLAGLPQEVPGTTVNRLCGSSLDAVTIAARAIKSGEMALVVAGGVESMSRAPFVTGKATEAFSRVAKIEDTTIGWRFVNPLMKSRYGIDSMPETAENVAEAFAVTRADQDAFALRSQQRAAAAIAEGRMAEEIVAIAVPQKKGESLVVASDEHPRATSLEALAKLKPIVRPDGTVTAGNASGVNDGACALVVASEEAAKRNGLTPRARVVAGAVTGVAPRIMGFAPAAAMRKVLAIAGLRLTTWSSGVPQAAGMWFQVELPNAETITELQFQSPPAAERGAAVAAGGAPINTATGPGFPRAFRVETSTDGSSWQRAADGASSGPMTIAAFTPVSAKFLRITLTTGVETGPPWSIQSLKLYRAPKP